VVVSPRFASSSWTTRPDRSSETSRALVRNLEKADRSKEGGSPLDRVAVLLTVDILVRENDVLCLLESEREARRLR
jgi:hypothetical protein